MNNKINFYELLGIKNDASNDEIKSAYKKQMKIWHPDINKSSDAYLISKELNNAKEVLLDEEKRKAYDLFLEEMKNKKHNKNVANQTDNNKEMLTKWQYFYQWLKHANVPVHKKVIGSIGVMLESLLCSLLSILLKVLAYVSEILEQVAGYLLKIILAIFMIFAIIFIVSCTNNGLKGALEMFNNDTVTLIIIAFFILTIILIIPVLKKLTLSEKTYDFLYNDINIKLFKKCVGYKD